LFSLIHAANERKWLATASTSGAEIKNDGIIEDHTYLIVDSAIIEENNAPKYNIIKLRNPSGRSRW